MMIEIMGMYMKRAEYEFIKAQAKKEWNNMDNWDKEIYDDFEDFEYMFIHDCLYPDVD